MDLAISIFRNEKVYTSIDIQKPRAEIIAKAYDAANKGLFFKSIFEFIAGSVETIYGNDDTIETDPKKIKQICGMMPFVSAEAVAMKIMCKLNKDDTVEGVYSCPRCHHKIITGTDGLVDTRDKINDLPVIIMDSNANNEINVQLSEPIKIKNVQTGEVIEEINSFTMRYPNLNDCMIAENGQSNDVIIQLRMYCNSLLRVNGNEIDKSWIGSFGMLMFNRIWPEDLEKITIEMKRYGIIKTKKRECIECGKVWDAPLSTSNFFVSGLHAT